MVVPDSDKSPPGKPNQGRPTFWGSESLSLTCKSQAWEATVWVVVAVGRQRAITEHCRAQLGLPCFDPRPGPSLAATGTKVGSCLPASLPLQAVT